MKSKTLRMRDLIGNITIHHYKVMKDLAVAKGIIDAQKRTINIIMREIRPDMRKKVIEVLKADFAKRSAKLLKRSIKPSINGKGGE
jgi:hypothetical protein